MTLKAAFITVLFAGASLTTPAQKTKTDTLVAQLAKRLTPGEWEYLNSKKTDKSVLETIALIVPWITAFAAISGFFIQQYWQKQRDIRNLLYTGLSWFEGDTQKRSIGIALIEASWSQDKVLQQAWRSVLTNQAIYLIGRSKQLDAPHEIDNLDRIMDIIRSRKLSTKRQVKQLNDILTTKINNKGDVPGLKLESHFQNNILQDWLEELKEMEKNVK
jgi:hypothetical protein